MNGLTIALVGTCGFILGVRVGIAIARWSDARRRRAAERSASPSR